MVFNPFQIVYGQNPSNKLDLTLVPHPRKFSIKAEDMAKHIKAIHKQAQK